LVAFLKAQFWPTAELQFSKEQLKAGLQILVRYAGMHIPGFHLDKTLEILHETLYS
jgi:hypothetical protein